MNWDAIGAIGEVTGASVVIVTLIYLAQQVRNNLIESRLAAVHEISATYTAWAQSIAASRELATIWNAGLIDFDGLDEVSKLRFLLNCSAGMRIFEDAYIQFSSGRMNETDWHIYENIIQKTAGTSGMAAYMERRKELHSPDYANLVLKMMANSKPESGSIFQ
jgi:hypothetical protein